MIARIVVLFSLIAVPVCGQSRVYTNADLGKPLAWQVPPATVEQLAGLTAHQFVAPVDPGTGPTVTVLHSSSTDGPFGLFYMPPTQPLSEPWWFTTHVGRGRFGAFGGTGRRSGEQSFTVVAHAADHQSAIRDNPAQGLARRGAHGHQARPRKP
jgi:hypothetical protein